jgi:hypothetical protein
MGLAQLEFDLAVREWATKSTLIIKPSADNQIIIQYVDGDILAHWSDHDIEVAKTNILTNVQNIALKHGITYGIDFQDVGIGDLAVVITVKSELTRRDASTRYYDLLILGVYMTSEQFKELQILKKKFGFV